MSPQHEKELRRHLSKLGVPAACIEKHVRGLRAIASRRQKRLEPTRKRKLRKVDDDNVMVRLDRSRSRSSVSYSVIGSSLNFV